MPNGAARVATRRRSRPVRSLPRVGETHEYVGAPEIRPNPDPSVVTIQAIDRLDTHRQELLNTRFESVGERFRSIERATDKFETNLTRVPTETSMAINALRSVIVEMFRTVDEKFSTVNEKFSAVNREFTLRDSFQNQSALDRKEELKTALSAAEKAVDKQATSFGEATQKSENGTAELLRQQAELLRSTKEGLETQINDAKVRLAIAEATASAAKEAAATAAATASANQQTLTTSKRDETSDRHSGNSNTLAFAAIGISLFFGFIMMIIAGITLFVLLSHPAVALASKAVGA
jgi:hypothetical protein